MEQTTMKSGTEMGDGQALAALKSDVSGARLMKTVGNMARWTKLAGTQPELESLETLRAELIDAGYRVSLILHDAYISLPGKASLRIGTQDYKCITHSMAQSTPQGGLEAELVDVGAGKDSDLAGRDISGRIVVVDGIATPVIAQRMSRLGAAGIIHVSPHEHRHEMCVSPVWGNPSTQTEQELPTCSIVTVSDVDGADIRKRIAKETSGLTALIQAEVDTGWRKTPLLVAEMEAPDTAVDAPFVLFSGHHDTWYYGVMDNGSANATIMEVARLVASQRHQWKRNLRICIWSGHSQGRYSGSAWYADQNWGEFDKYCVAHVNIDSPGAIGAVNLRNTGVMSALRPLAARAIMAEADQELAGKPKVRSADESFQGLGIPSMFGSLSGQVQDPNSKMRNALGWWWHTPDDLIDKIDEANLVRDTKVVLESVYCLISEDVLPIDIGAPLSALLGELSALQSKIGANLDLSPMIERIRQLVEYFKQLNEIADAELVNDAIKHAARELVLLEHSHGDRFAHEPAINQPAWPALDALRRLAQEEPASEPFHFAYVDAVRSRNRIAWHLDLIAERARVFDQVSL
ncbi:M28 family peptidase [Brucella pituitosa]|uniref:M28 family peptidase n=1 Tax=Brucella pituitosa TaxID=571256 RepID=UPI002005D68E|nr:M28 family peptidase [Brucella pituitosa]MCK4207099.1 M28 family peptidase [Brucella pituitosa]